MHITQKFMILAVLIAGFTSVNCQGANDLDVNDLEKKLHENGLPESIDANATQKVEDTFREKCEKQGAGHVVDSLKNQQEYVKECVSQHINTTTLQDELDEAKKTGSMDEVFGKYCKKWPDVYKCVENATDQVRLCMNDAEKEAFNRSLDILDQLQEFMCFKDGDRLAMFVAEGGVECVNERQEEVKQCINATVGDRLPSSTDQLSVANLPTFLFSEEDCQDFDKIRECVNTELEKCKDSTPANIVDAFFKFLKKQMPCKKTLKASASQSAPSGSSKLTWNFVVLGLLPLLSLKFKFY